jgi:uncharacterized protein (TIGR01777 family)
MEICVTGSSGLVGSALVEALFAAGHTIQCLSRNKEKTNDSFWNFAAEGVREGRADAYVHLAGENVADGRWSPAKKKRILESRVLGTKALVNHLLSLEKKPSTFCCASAIGYYGSRGEERLTESSSLGSGFLAEVCKHWEAETRALEKGGIRVVNLRFGMILSPQGGALHKMIPPFRMGLGGTIGSGRQYMSWISIRDVVQSILFLLAQDSISGPVNIVSPTPVTNREFTRALGKALGRPTLLPLPAFAAKAGFGQMADEMLLGSSRVIPDKLLQAGYSYVDEELSQALAFCIEK